jgi:hypothetical protein
MAELIAIIIAIAILIWLACFIMVITNILFDVFAVTVIILAAAILVFGALFGFTVAIKNTIKVYQDLYKSRRRR